MGPEMMQDLRDQAERFGTRFITENVTRFEPGADGEPHTVWVDEDVYKARAVVLAMGAEHKKLGVPGEEELGGRGVSYCATCDAAFYKDRTTIIVGGGDSAMEEAIFLTKFATKVTIVHRRHELRASKIMQDRALANPKIDFLWNTVVDDVLGDGSVEALKVRDVVTGAVSDFAGDGLFVAIGHDPTTGLFRGQLDLDDDGYIITGADSTRTSVEGVFAAGDVQDHVYRQAVTAAGSGCMAAIEVERWLAARD